MAHVCYCTPPEKEEGEEVEENEEASVIAPDKPHRGSQSAHACLCVYMCEYLCVSERAVCVCARVTHSRLLCSVSELRRVTEIRAKVRN